MISQKSLIVIISIILLDTSLFYCQLNAAQLGKDKATYSISGSYGAARQFSDIPSDGGWGFNANIGKNLYYEEFSKFSFDLTGNLFYLKTKGLDINLYPFTENEVIKNTGYDAFFYNYKMGMAGIGIDLKSTLNQYRTEQNWYASLLLGVNSGIFTTNMDIKNQDGVYYIEDFNMIRNLSKNEKDEQLHQILDGDYETKAENFDGFPLKMTIMPSVGLELGYDITDYLSVFVGDKLYFRASNKIDGETYIDDNRDNLNYLHAGLNFYFGKKRGNYYYPEQRYESVPSVNEPAGYKIPKEVEDHNLPEVKILEPEEKQSVSEEKYVNIKASLINISSANEIYCKVNDEKVKFDYSENYVQFVAELKDGENKIQIYAKNDYGQARDVVTIYFHEKELLPGKPVIELKQPSSIKYKSEDEVFTILATLKDIKEKNNISITANDYPLKSFNYNNSTGEFKIKVRLAEGVNTFVITANNESGFSQTSFDVYYKTDIPETGSINDGLPEIIILSPNQKTGNLTNDLIDFKAKITGVKNRNDIVFTVNDMENKIYDFDSNTGILSDKISIFDESTVIKIVANNAFGEASNEITVNYSRKIETNSNANQGIEFLEVSEPDEDCNVDITIKVTGATSKNQIKMYLNQFELRNFSFNSSSEVLKSSIYLDEGDNVIKVIFDHNGTEETGTYNIKCGEDTIETGNDQQDDSTMPKPYIEFLYPGAFSTIELSHITLRALIKNIENKYNIRVEINDEPYYAFNYDEETGNLSADLNLEEEDYKFVIKAANSQGNSESELVFSYEKPLAGPPEVLINSPRNGFSTEDKVAVLRASIDNLKDPKDIRVYLNGVEFKDFDYDIDRSIAFGYIPLKLGQNTLKVEAINKLGSNYDEVSFKCKVAHLPGVQITSPKDGVIAGTALVFVEAVVQNVPKSTDVIMYVNGKTNRSYKLENENLESKIYLEKGVNEIIVKAFNDAGSASDTIRVTFSGPPTTPEITFLKPAKTNISVSERNFTLEAKVTGIKHSSFVNLFVNELLTDDLQYYKDENKIVANIKLNKGINIIKLQATNDTGSITESTRIYLE